MIRRIGLIAMVWLGVAALGLPTTCPATAQEPPAAPPELETPVPVILEALEVPPAVEATEIDGAGSDAQFFSELGYKDVASAADAARALAIFVSEGRRGGGDFIADKKYLRDQNITTGWLERATPTDPLSKGRLASLLCRALHVKGGLWMRLLGPVPRYALRECVYLGVMKEGVEYQHVTGGELAGVIDRSDSFRLKKAGQEPAELSGLPSGTTGSTE